MKAMILAAGRGERMRPLTDACPRRCCAVGGKPLIAWHLEKLAARRLRATSSINHAWLGEQIEQALGDGSRFGAADPVLRANRPRWRRPAASQRRCRCIGRAAVHGRQRRHLRRLRLCRPAAAAAVRWRQARRLAHLVLVDNPAHHPRRRFRARNGDRVEADGAPRLTFSGIGVVSSGSCSPPSLPVQRAPLAPLAASRRCSRTQCADEHHGGAWFDIGTPQRLQH